MVIGDWVNNIPIPNSKTRNRLNGLNTVTNLKSKNWRGRLILFLRWFVGGSIGYFSSFFLFLNARNTINLPPFIGPIMFGQHLLFADLYLSNTPAQYVSDVESYYIVIFCSLLWGLIGASLASGNRRQFIGGLIFLALYLIAGGLSYMYYWWSLLLS